MWIEKTSRKTKYLSENYDRIHMNSRVTYEIAIVTNLCYVFCPNKKKKKRPNENRIKELFLSHTLFSSVVVYLQSGYISLKCFCCPQSYTYRCNKLHISSCLTFRRIYSYTQFVCKYETLSREIYWLIFHIINAAPRQIVDANFFFFSMFLIDEEEGKIT